MKYTNEMYFQKRKTNVPTDELKEKGNACREMQQDSAVLRRRREATNIPLGSKCLEGIPNVERICEIGESWKIVRGRSEQKCEK